MRVLVTYVCRPVTNSTTWEIVDITTDDEIPIILIDSKGAADDFHETLAKDITAFLNSQCKVTVL